MLPQIIQLLNFVVRFSGRELRQYRAFVVVFITEGLIFPPCLFKPLS